MEHLLYADAKNCALGMAVAEKVFLKDIPGGLFADLLTEMNRKGAGKDEDGGSGDKYSNRCISAIFANSFMGRDWMLMAL